LFSRNFFLSFLIAFFLIPAVCSAEASTDKAPSRIVSLSPSTTEILFAIGAGPQITGVTDFCVWPPEARKIPRVGGFDRHSLEAILARDPGLVTVTPNSGTRIIYEKLVEFRKPVISVPFYSLEDLLESFSALGEVSGHEREANAARRSISGEIEKYRGRALQDPKIKMLYVTWRFPLIVAGKGTMEDDALRTIGVQNIAGRSRTRYPKWTMEAVFREDPDVILDASAFERDKSWADEMKEARAFWGKYRVLRAVREGRVYLFKKEALPVPGPRTPMWLEAVMLAAENTPGPENPYAEKVHV
jgi:iron complex transport system substrate-binding protein